MNAEPFDRVNPEKASEHDKFVSSFLFLLFVDRSLEMTGLAVFFTVSHSRDSVIPVTNFINIQLGLRRLHPCSLPAGQTGLFLKREEE